MGKIFNRENTGPSWDDEAVEAKISAAKSVVEDQEDGQFPPPLLRSIFVQALVAVALIIVCSCLALATKHLSYLVGYLFAAYLCYNCVSLYSDFKQGLIRQRVLLCSSVNRNFMGRQIIMQDVNKEPTQIYEFFFTKKGACPFIESGVYIVYTHDKDPKRIVAWRQT